MWSTEMIVFSTKISWQTFQLYFFTFYCRQSIGSTCYLTTFSGWIDPIRVVLPFKEQDQLILYASNLKIWVRRSMRLYSLYLSARRWSKISSYEKRSHWLWTNNALFTKFKCDLYDAGYAGFYTPPLALKCTRTQKLDFIDWQALSGQAFFGPKGSYE